MQLEWNKCDGGGWCPLLTVDLNHMHFDDMDGVYIIWHAGNPCRVVYVGQGIVAARIASHRQNKAITGYARHGKLLVTWAAVPAAQRDGVERYLADQWSPLVGDVHPDARPIAVNSPW